MSRAYIPLIVFFFFVIEGTLFQLFVPHHHEWSYVFVPRFMIVFIILIGIHFTRPVSLVYGLIVGAIYDVVYTQLLGAYLFGFALIGYFFVFPYKRVQDMFLVQLAIIIAALVFFEYYQYGLYALIGLADIEHRVFLQERVLTSVVLNTAFAILIYFPFLKLMQYVLKQEMVRNR
ncbi:rod shape-determining protein MreD [Halalkalibacter sp. APA_J-10(15)]|uniref:rod shape-determining protein MreD n=1 Tax=Halalkalibacter sp. APA_J-10(15) TaxID=2933805 RepID=UPI001FF440F6|nr:rod shape-determining protein MreD [Halalkalibacter sp. APA_J-10(15)]MCK0473533.1 rod shape-determining protein MreD [Halalkalibacter sp. APA_J-10(15)]